MKPTMTLAHGGGKRFAMDSDDYRTILAWIRSGARLQRWLRKGRARSRPSGNLSTHGDRAGRRTASSAGDRAFQRRAHGRLYPPGALHIERRRSRGRQPDGVVDAKRRGETSVLVRAAGHVASVGIGVIGPQISDYPKVARWNFIDEHVFEKLRRFQIVPSELPSDSEFLRRVCLDLTGTLPPPERVREFSPARIRSKREKVIDALIGVAGVRRLLDLPFRRDLSRRDFRERTVAQVEPGILGVDSLQRREQPPL